MTRSRDHDRVVDAVRTRTCPGPSVGTSPTRSRTSGHRATAARLEVAGALSDGFVEDGDGDLGLHGRDLPAIRVESTSPAVGPAIRRAKRRPAAGKSERMSGRSTEAWMFGRRCSHAERRPRVDADDPDD